VGRTSPGGSVFAAGYALDDPGGLAGAGLVAAWTVPVVGLGAFALLAPDRAATVLVADAENRQAESLIAPAAADRPASSRATGTRNGEQDT
jgi:hypothetical protein